VSENKKFHKKAGNSKIKKKAGGIKMAAKRYELVMNNGNKSRICFQRLKQADQPRITE